MFNTNRISISAIGKIKKNWIKEGINKYSKRMPKLIINEFKYFDIQNLKNQSSNKIIISLSEEGRIYNSFQFASLLSNFKNQRIIFLIGDADGIPSEIKSNSNLILSLSPLTFPHELARLLLLEQIYRAVSITQNSPYHRS